MTKEKAKNYVFYDPYTYIPYDSMAVLIFLGFGIFALITTAIGVIVGVIIFI